MSWAGRDLSTAAGTQPTRLDPAVIYRTPTGRLCRLFGIDKDGDASGPTARLVYVEDKRRMRADTDWGADGFVLSRENWRLLQVVG